MSRKLRDIDERARRTRNQIARAVIGLGVREGLDNVSVQQVAREAGISRSTFYAHYNSLGDYLTRSYTWVLERGAQLSAMQPGGDRQALPVRAILDHIAGNRDYVAATLNVSYRPAMMAAGEKRLRVVAGANLERLRPDMPAEDREAMATFIAGGFMGILRAWTEGGMKQAPETIQARFERLCDSITSLDGQLPACRNGD